MESRKCLLSIGLAILSFHVFGQKTTDELGEITFKYFQQNNLDSFYLLKPSFAELTEFGKTIGVDTASVQYKEFVDRYPAVIKHFKTKCNELRSDTVNPGLNWSVARLDKIETSTKKIYLDNSDPNSKSITITIIDILFISNEKRFKLSLGDANNYNGIWKPGNKIDLSQVP